MSVLSSFSWAKAVKKRDKYTCQQCNSTERVCAHHIKKWDKYPELRFDITNGITLCAKCHNKKHKKPPKPKKEIITHPEWLSLPETGEKYGYWTVLDLKIKKNENYYCVCKCDCGTIKPVNKSCLKDGSSKSCGKCGRRTHGISGTSNPSYKHGGALRNNILKEYKCWSGMKSRCYNKNSRKYNYYGGRGIKICQKWLDNFDNFLKDMGYAPSSKHSIDRINVNGNYEPSNCRWATRIEQARNVRTNKLLTMNNSTKTISEWSELLKIPISTICNRKRIGRSDEECLQKDKFKIDSVFLTLNNQTKSATEWSKVLGINRETIYSRVEEGHSDEECLQKDKFRKYLTLNNQKKSVLQWSKTLGINCDTIYYRIKKGYSDVMCLQKPKRRFLTLNNQTKTIEEWSKILGINKNTIRSRIRSGFSDQECLSLERKNRWH